MRDIAEIVRPGFLPRSFPSFLPPSILTRHCHSVSCLMSFFATLSLLRYCSSEWLPRPSLGMLIFPRFLIGWRRDGVHSDWLRGSAIYAVRACTKLLPPLRVSALWPTVMSIFKSIMILHALHFSYYVLLQNWLELTGIQQNPDTALPLATYSC